VRANPNLSAPGITSVERVSATAEADVVRKPMYHYHRDGGDGGAGRDSPSDDLVTAEPHQQRRPTVAAVRSGNHTLVSCSGAGTSGHVGPFPTPGPLDWVPL